jgi:hypothetical protein
MPAPHPDGHQSPSGSAIFHRDHMKCQAYMASFDVPLVLWLGSLGGLGSLFGSRWFDVFFGAAPQKNDFLNWQGLKQTPQTPKLPKTIISPTSRTLLWEVWLWPSSWDRD